MDNRGDQEFQAAFDCLMPSRKRIAGSGLPFRNYYGVRGNWMMLGKYQYEVQRMLFE
jgi:hypothetical protein